MKIAIHGKRFIEESKPIIQQVFEILSSKDAEIFVSDGFSKFLKNGSVTTGEINEYKEGDDLSLTDVFFTLGGDGTLLEAVTHIGDAEIPILGINTGKLGFLATTSREDLDKTIEAVFTGNYEFDSRTLLRLDSEPEVFDGKGYALNDFTILKKDTSSMIVVHAFINDKFLNSYWADGLIVSTPTGSTGYSLSCGGPIVLPQSDNFMITPVSPHNLTVRPLVVPDDSVMSFKIEGRKQVMVSLDSRYQSVSSDVKLKVSKEKFEVKLIRLEGHNYFDTLRQKLNWGLDVRN